LKIGIVGSRRYTNKAAVEELVMTLPQECTVVSGGCRGVDTWAITAAKKRGLETQEHIPNLKACTYKWQFTKAYYQRNLKIAHDVDVLYAFVMSDRKGGTESTIKYAEQARKTIIIQDIQRVEE